MERTIYRIMDANFNRAREALRVIEEFCRFALNNPSFSAKIKALRHRLCGQIGLLDTGQMLSCRDSDADVGKDLRVGGQMTRTSLEDCLTAAFKRLTEALRVLAETGQTITPLLYDEFEKMRFDAYTLEKQVFEMVLGQQRFSVVRLYVLINADMDSRQDALFNLLDACIEGGADCLQLRCKSIQDSQFMAWAFRFVELCKSGGVVSIINDRPDIAIVSNADGIHLGQGDLTPQQVRKLQQKPMILGLSTHSMPQLQEAVKQPCTYIALGPVFKTLTKPNEPTAGIDYLKNGLKFLADYPLGHVAIGGIGLSNVSEVLQVGAKTVAVCSAVCEQARPAEACRQLKQLITSV